MSTNKKIVAAINEAFNRSDLETFLSHCAEEVRWTIVGKEPIVGKEAIAAFMGKMDSDHAMEIDVEHIIAEGDLVACNGTLRMKHEGGAPYEGRYCDMYHFKGGKVATLQSYVVDGRKA